MSVGHASRELVSTSPSGVISTEGSDWGSIPDDEFPRFPRIGWQAFASTPLEAFFNTAISPRLGQTDQAPARSQRGPMASIPFFAAPVSVATRFDPQCFRVLLLRRLWCQLPLSSANLPVWPAT